MQVLVEDPDWKWLKTKMSLGESLGKTLSETLGETFRAEKSRQESCRESPIGSYAWFSARFIPRLAFFTRVVILGLNSIAVL